ncbi:MAG: class I adenylate-forming enzyme family protein [Thermoanaerobaculales bacterium]|jgi:acyl-CoA synthetase (AMP-forming)/AMP-acid ligase II|nr:class I adenylate-forming enzyme family protein [Thermoanaerobaculales bacterium]
MEAAKERRSRELYDQLLPNMADYVRHWAREKPDRDALIEHDTGEKVTWKAFDRAVSAFSAKLLSLGLKKGDVVATSLPLLKEHVYLLYACYRTGIIAAPLDLRLKAGEISYCLERIRPKAYFFLGKTPVADFRPMIEEVMKTAPYVEHWVQFQKEEDQIIAGAVGITRFAADIKKRFLFSLLTGSVRRAHRAVGTRDPALIIFTTGSTGAPKPALLCHRNILVQNIGLGTAFEMDDDDVMLVNLPPSHVGCVTEQLATTIYGGGVSVILHIFDAEKSLQAVQEHGVTVIGQIPALFNMQWRLPNYDDYDLSSLRFVLYGGQAVSVEFLKKMRTMAPKMGTGLGLTETAGFCTYTDVDADVEDIAKSIGHPMGLLPLSIREPMTPDGAAGVELPPGETGEICFSGPQIFLGYLNDEEATAAAVSTDGICYTGDMGFYDDAGLHFAGRSKLVIKPKGYQVFPDAVADHIAAGLEGRVGNVAVVGVEHEIYSEAIMAFVESAEGHTVEAVEVMAVCREIAAYSRPSHVEILPAGEMPLNRVAKTDFMILKQRAGEIVKTLRSKGEWDV